MLVSHPTIHERHQMVCVIDPALALSRHGVALVKCLGSVIELWVVRELWHILNDTTFYIKQPQLISPRGIFPEKTEEQEYHALEETVLSLKEWEKFRMKTNLAGLNFFWIGDSPRESYLPQNRSPDILGYWESIVRRLDEQFSPLDTTDYILPLIFRNTTALVATLESATILTYQTSIEYENNLPPEICKTLEQWGISCKSLSIQDSMVALERTYLHDLLVRTSGAKFLWSDIHLCILHLLIPADLLDFQRSNWFSAKGFWYSI
jgi:hypothetical protein